MRTIVCTDYNGDLRKLIWLTEYKTGISAGIYDKNANPHATYHIDGAYHHKLTHKGSTLKVFKEQRPPLNSILTQEQLLGTATFYREDMLRRLPKFKSDGRVDVVLVLCQSIFRDIGSAGFNSYILHCKHEESFLADVYASYNDDTFSLISVNVLALQQFPDHKVGMVVYRGRLTHKSPASD